MMAEENELLSASEIIKGTIISLNYEYEFYYTNCFCFIKIYEN